MSPEQMDAIGSLRKISSELKEIGTLYTDGQISLSDIIDRVEGASWLISYICDALDLELQHAAARGRMLTRIALEEGNIMPTSSPPDVPKKLLPGENMGGL